MPYAEPEGPRKLQQFRAAAFALAIGLWPGLSPANPQGPNVVAGQAGFANPAPNVLNVTNSPGAIINWQSFGIAPSEVTRFIQNNAASAVLNRVVGQDPSAILGQLMSNGRVFLINPNGIVFGPNSVVDTAGLVASTLNITDEDFREGNYQFDGDGSSGAIRNQGLIKAGENGNVFLIAPSIENSGVIQSEGGDLVLAAGRSVQLASLDALGVTFEIQAPEDSVVNLGQLLSHGGAAAIFAGTLRHSGDINVDAVTVDAQGQVQLVAQGDAIVDGTISARGPDLSSLSPGERAGVRGSGGTIQILGTQVGLFDNARIDASGDTGGGEILIGGDYQGKGDTKTASATYVGPDASISVNAISEGDGGTAIVWADDTAQVYGRISARGGQKSGNGGFVETSGRRYLEVTRAPDITAPNGDAGTWLLDPENITISNAVDNNITPSSPFQPQGAGNAALSTATLQTALNGGGTVIVDTTGGVALTGNLTVSDAVTKTVGPNATLDLRAHNNLNINASITSTGGQLSMLFDADQDSVGGGVVNLGNVTLDANGGTINASNETINIASGATINSALTVDTLNVSAGTAAVETDSVVNGILLLTGGTLTGAGDITVAGLFDWRGGTLQGTNGTEQLNANGGISLTTAAVRTLDNRILNNTGIANMGPDITMTNGAVFNNLLGGTLNLPGNSKFPSVGTGGTVNNAGSMVLTGTGAGSWGSTVFFNNTGTVDIQNTRTLFITTDNSATPHTGDFNIASGAIYRVNKPTVYDVTSDFTGAGTLRIEDGGVGSTLNGSFASTLNIILANFGKINFNFDAEVATLVHSNADGGTIGGTGSLKVLNTWTAASPVITINGNLILDSGINQTLNTNTLNGMGTLTVQGSLTHSSGTLTVNPALVVDGTFILNGGTFDLNAGLTVGSSFNWSGTSTIDGGGVGTITIGSGAVMSVTGAGAHVLSNVTLDILSGGTVNHNTTTGNELDLRLGAVVNNSGIYDFVSAQQVDNTGGAATFNNLAGGVLRMSAGSGTSTLVSSISFNNTGGTVEILAGGALSLGGNALLLDSASTLTGGGTFGGNVTSDGTIRPGDSPGTLTINGNLTLNSNSVIEFEVLSFAGGAPVAGTDFDQLQISGTASLDGSINLVGLSPYDPMAADNFDFITFASASGNFGGPTNPNVTAPFGVTALTTAINPTNVNIQFDTAGTINRWNILVDGNWDVPGNWSLGVPLPTHSVLIEQPGTLTITISGGATKQVAEISSAETLAISGSSLQIDGSSRIDGDVTLTAGSLTINADSTITGDLSLAGGSLGGTGTLTATAAVNWTGATLVTKTAVRC